MANFSSAAVRQERTGWRDDSLSLRHRVWGYDCPGVDLDFPMLEFSTGQPVALIEYKARGARIPDLKSPTYAALRVLANNSSIPFMVVFYDASTWVFRAIPANQRGVELLNHSVVMSEREYVAWLYRLRRLTLPTGLSNQLSDYKPEPSKWI